MNLQTIEVSTGDKVLQRCLAAGLFGLAMGLLCVGVYFYA
jgi:hypothetical protein